MKRMKKAIASFALVLSSLLFIYGVCELVFPFLLVYLPLKTHWYVEEGIRVLSQYSKRGVTPEKYIALVGDSYAAGKGDWFLSVDRNGRPAFHSAHLIHRDTAKDVVTFGANGAGSLRGLVGEPLAKYRYINASYRFEMEPPAYILVYFYEGNDLNDDLVYLRLRYRNSFDVERIYDTAYFANFIQRAVHWGDPLFWRVKNRSIQDHLIFGHFFYCLVDAFVREKFGASQDLSDLSPWPPGDVNRVLIDGKPVSIPDRLQSPALELTTEEMDLSVYTFEQSLRYLKNRFSASRIGILYIPSPLSSYTLSSETVTIQTYENRSGVYLRERVYERSDAIASKIEKAAENCDVAFVDARPYIRRKSSKMLVHGPLDWKHFNREGYTALAEAAVDIIESMDAQVR
jgi:hypothetical protein